MYGSKLRIGLMLPCVNSVAEPEFARMAPEGVETFAARMLMRGATKLDQLAYMEQALDDTVESLEDVADIFVYGCTSGSFVQGPEFDRTITRRITQKTGRPAVSASQSLTRALQEIGAVKIALATPYLEEVNRRQIEFFRGFGIETVSCEGLALTARGASGRKQPEEVRELARRVFQNSDAQALVISCTNFRSTEILEPLEREFGVPVISSNQASFWNALRTAGIHDPITGFGSLLSKF